MFKLSTRLAAAAIASTIATTEVAEAQGASNICINDGLEFGRQKDCNKIWGNEEPGRTECKASNAQQLAAARLQFPDATVQERTSAKWTVVCVEPKAGETLHPQPPMPN